MPGLRERSERKDAARAAGVFPAGGLPEKSKLNRWSRVAGMFPRCGNPRCGHGPIRLWRSRRSPLFEGRWCCSEECLRTRLEAAVNREGRSDEPGAGWMHRIPLRLMLLEQGGISAEQLRRAGGDEPAGARAGGGNERLEEWLHSSGVLSEAALTRAISAQWSCPVFSLSATRRSQDLGAAIPAFLADALGALPVRVSAGRLLYVAFLHRVDRSLSYAIEHVTGLRIAAGMARESEFRREQARFLLERSPKTRFVEAEDRGVLAQKMAAWIEREQAVEARLARIHEMWWLRIWRREQRGTPLPAWDTVEDLLATAGPAGGAEEGRK